MEKYLSVREVSQILQYSPKYIYNLKSQGKLKGIKKGQKLLFTPEEINVYQESISQSSSSSSSRSSPHVHMSHSEPITTTKNEAKKEIGEEHITFFPDEQNEQKPFFPGEKGNEFLISISSYREGSWKWIDEFETAEAPSGAQIKAQYGIGKYRLTVSRKTREGWKFFGRHNIDIGQRPDEIKKEDEITILQKQNKELEERIAKLESEWINLKNYDLTSRNNLKSLKTDYLKDTIKLYDHIKLIHEILNSQAKMDTETLLPLIFTALKEANR